VPQKLSQSPKTNFAGGLVTEAGPLTFPENATVDELNMNLLRDGSRRRRLGVTYEAGFVENIVGYTTSSKVHTHTWENVGSVPSLTFIVVQVDGVLHFFDKTSAALSSTKKAFTLDLTAYDAPYGTGAANALVDVASIKGTLVVASAEINTIKIDYDPALDTISAEEIEFRVRDFQWLSDRTTFEDLIPLASVNDNRRYDTRNSGWRGPVGGGALGTYITAEAGYPPLTHAWYSGKNASGNFSVSEWDKVYSGSSIISNGSYILDLYTGNRRSASGLISVDNTIEYTRFKTVAAWAGRVFYAGMTSRENTSSIYFSQIVDDFFHLGECFQSNDPTAEDFSDLLATDGGFIEIPEAYDIKKLHVLGPTLLVFAANGVWQIRGIDNNFKATDYAVSKVSDVGLELDQSFVSAEGRPYWWTSAGIYTLRASAEQQVLSPVNISQGTIQSFYNNILRKDCVKATYDVFENRIFWFYPDDDEVIECKLRNILIFDEKFNAFLPWAVADDTSYIVDALFLDGEDSVSIEFDVVDASGNLVIDGSGNQVVISKVGASFSSTTIKVTTVTTSGSLTFSEFTDTSFLDWDTADYSSYLVTGYSFNGDMTLPKSIQYLTPYFSVTESSVVTPDGGISFTYDRPSSCKVEALWDFKRTTGTPAQQAYKPQYLPIPTAAGPFEYPYSVIKSRLRIRGRGQEVQLKFSGEQGYDFHILGYDIITGAKPSL
jgi:hypothetical protein